MAILQWKQSPWFKGEIASLGSLGEVHIRAPLRHTMTWYVSIGGSHRSRGHLGTAEDAKAKAEAIVARFEPAVGALQLRPRSHV